MNRWMLVLLLSLLSAGLSAAVPAPGSGISGTSALRITTLDPRRTRIELADAEMERTVRRGTLDETSFALSGEPTLRVDGQPALPHVTRWYRVADLGAVEWQLASAEFELVEGVDVPPFNELGVETRDPAIYNAGEWYPPSPVQVSAPLILRDLRVVLLTLYPVQYNPVTRQARVYRNLSCDLVTTSDPGLNELTEPRQLSGSYAALYRGAVANLDERALDDVTGTPGGQLILCRTHPTVVQFADSIAHWKRMLGYQTVVDARASWTAATMRAAIQNAYANMDPPLGYVLIIGDPQAGSMAMPTDGANYDHSFGLGNNGDDLEDLGVGRLPVSSAAELATVYGKLVRYERDPVMADSLWTRRALLWANIEGNTIENRNTMYWSRQQFVAHTGVDSVHVVVGATNVDTLAQLFGRGIGYFFWRGSFIGQFDPALPFGLPITDKLPVVLTITCGTGNFEIETALSESFVLAGTASSPKGGVAAIGMATANTHQQYNNPISAGLVYHICNVGVEHLGVALIGAKLELLRAFPGGGSFIEGTIRWSNLMGDPSLQLWTDRIRPFEVEHPLTLAPGANCVSLHVRDGLSGEPVAGALVVLNKPDETFAQLRTDDQGHADVPVTVATTGDMSLCVSRSNHEPYRATIPCAVADLALTAIADSLIDGGTAGSDGNQNHLLEPGELIELPLWVRNSGTSQTAQQIQVSLTSQNPRLTVELGGGVIASLAAGDSARVTMRLRASRELRFDERIPLAITCVSGGYSSCSVVTLRAEAPAARLGQAVPQGGDGDHLLEPGESVSLDLLLANPGSVSLANITAELLSLTPFLIVEQPHATFQGLPPGTTTLQDGVGPVVRAHSETYPGSTVALRLIVLAANDYADTLDFTLPAGTRAAGDPTGPDAFGYYAYDNTDTAYSPSRAFEWMDIRAVGTNLNLHDPGEQPSSDSIMSRLRALPFEFVFYGETWSNITVCSNGWAAFGDRTDQDQNENYPIPGPLAPDALLAPFWDDLRTYPGDLGVWDYHDAERQRYIVQWEARSLDGLEPARFEIVLLDPRAERAADGSGIVIFQYQEIHDVAGFDNIPFATVGIEAPGCLVGLQYRHANIGAPGSAALAAGRAITFTTDVVPHFGGIRGRVTAAGSGWPIPQALVCFGDADSAATDEQGEYSLPAVRAGLYAVRVRANGYEPLDVADLLVRMDSLNVYDFTLAPFGAAEPTPRLAPSYRLSQNYPNPFNASTRIEFELAQAGLTTLQVYNVLGELVATLVDGPLTAGPRRVELSAPTLGSGVYFYRLTSGSYVATKKLVLLQ